jgi:hypothetical protein
MFIDRDQRELELVGGNGYRNFCRVPGFLDTE